MKLWLKYRLADLKYVYRRVCAHLFRQKIKLDIPEIDKCDRAMKRLRATIEECLPLKGK